MYDETARQATSDGTNFCEHLNGRGILPGIKVDIGVAPIEGTRDET